jgi:DNA-binding GntR family transcriptional regulator
LSYVSRVQSSQLHKAADIPSVGPVGRTTLRAAVVDRLRDAIVRGTIAPGALLRETELAAKLGVSATPVREALGELAAEGLVEIEAHRLKRVAPVDLVAMRDLLQVQAQLWRLGYEWGLPRITEPELRHLTETVSAYGAALAADDPFGAVRASHDFHSVIITASANRELLRATLDRRALVARFILLEGRETLSQAGLRQHQALLGDVRRRDIASALGRLDAMAARLILLTDKAT